MERASSVERLWLAMALAQLWCVSLGCQAEAEFEAACLDHEPGASLPERHIARQRRTRAVGQRPARRLSCVVRGRLILLAMHSQSEPLVVGICGQSPGLTPSLRLGNSSHLQRGRRGKRARKRSAENDKNAVRGNGPALRVKKSILVRGASAGDCSPRLSLSHRLSSSSLSAALNHLTRSERTHRSSHFSPERGQQSLAPLPDRRSLSAFPFSISGRFRYSPVLRSGYSSSGAVS